MAIIEIHYPNSFNEFGLTEPKTVQLAVDEDLIDGKTAEQVAEAAFEATNRHFDRVPAPDTLVGAIVHAFLAHVHEDRWYPSLSVGDLVRVPNNAGGIDTVLVEPLGFSHVGENNLEDALRKHARPTGF